VPRFAFSSSRRCHVPGYDSQGGDAAEMALIVAMRRTYLVRVTMGSEPDARKSAAPGPTGRRAATRYPGPCLGRHRAHLRAVPPTFFPAAYQDHHGRLWLPLARGRVSFIRRVDPRARSKSTRDPTLLAETLRAVHQGTIFTHRWVLMVEVGARRHKRFHFPIRAPLVASTVPSPRGGSRLSSSRCGERTASSETALDVIECSRLTTRPASVADLDSCSQVRLSGDRRAGPHCVPQCGPVTRDRYMTRRFVGAEGGVTPCRNGWG